MNCVNINIKNLRKSKGMTQDEFSKILGIKRSLLGAYEEKRCDPPLILIKKIFLVFRLPKEIAYNFLFEDDINIYSMPIDDFSGLLEAHKTVIKILIESSEKLKKVS